jgi:hypothetical protein
MSAVAARTARAAISRAMTVERLAKAISQGYGSGRYEDYKSWIRIRRKLSSPVSNLHAMRVPMYDRSLQLLSGLEHKASNVLLWLGCREVREQFPLWPDAHDHPLMGCHREIDARRRPVKGLLEICREAGIKHGFYPGTRIPFVATIDFAITLGTWDTERMVFWSCKPRELLDSAPNRKRMHERIEMEILYAKSVGARHVVIDGTQFPDRLSAQLDWLRPLKEEIDFAVNKVLLGIYATSLMQVADGRSLMEAKKCAARAVKIDGELAEAYFRAAAWQGLIDIDLGHEIQVWKPLRRDHKNLKSRLRATLLGV